MKKVSDIKNEIIELINKSLDKETCILETENIRVFWYRTKIL